MFLRTYGAARPVVDFYCRRILISRSHSSSSGGHAFPGDHGASATAETRSSVHHLRLSVVEYDADGIHASYKTLVPPLMKTGVVDLIGKDTFFRAFDVLLASGRRRDVDLMKLMLADALVHCDKDEASRLHNHVFHGLLTRSSTRSAFKWLSVKPALIVPAREQWHALIKACAEGNALRLIHLALRLMRQLACPPTPLTFELLFRTLFVGGFVPTPSDLRKHLVTMKRHGLTHDPHLERLLRDAYTRHSHPPQAEQAVHVYQDIFQKDSEETGLSVHISLPIDRLDRPLSKLDMEKLLALTVHRQPKGVALQLYRRFKGLGFEATQSTLAAVLHGTCDSNVVNFWENAFSIRADASLWARLIHNAVLKGTVAKAISMYNSALSMGIRPTNTMFHPILRALCSGFLRPPDEPTIDRALAMYQEYMRLNQVRDEQRDAATPANTPDAPIYNTLLRVLSSSSNTTKYFPIAVSLLEEMQRYNVAMDNMTATTVVILLLRCSSDFQEAFKFYELVCRSEDGRAVLDQEGYIAVLNAFCKVSGKTSAVPPPRLYFEIVKDMQKAGHQIPPKVYTILLQRMASLASQLSSLGGDEASTSLSPLVDAVKKTHQLLVVDASLNPDAPLWNQLMDTYQRVGCFAEAYQIWNNLFRSGQHNHASLSIILDTCGRANAYNTALRIWTDMKHSGFRPNQNNWNTWLECLCRVGKLDQAVKTLCLEMGQSGSGVRPDAESARILISFASSKEQREEVHKRIMQHLPSIWKKLPLKDV